MVRILAFAGSSRKDSFNKKLVKIAAQGARDSGADVVVVDLKDYNLPLFNQDDEAEHGAPQAVIELKKLLLGANGFLIASPEYNSSITPLLKNTIDWCSRTTEKGELSLSVYRGKIAGIMSASPGNLGGLRSLVILRALLENIQVMVLPHQVAVSQAHEAFKIDHVLKDEKTHNSVLQIGRQLSEMLQKL